MNRNHTNQSIPNVPPTPSTLLRITMTLLLVVALIAGTPAALAQTTPHRVVKTYPINRAKAENLQRWVNAGHDTWCRDPKLVAAHTLEPFAPDAADSTYELASQPLVHKSSHGNIAIYTYNSLDGQTTYRITLRRPQWLSPTSGSRNNTVWFPTHLETLTNTTT